MRMDIQVIENTMDKAMLLNFKVYEVIGDEVYKKIPVSFERNRGDDRGIPFTTIDSLKVGDEVVIRGIELTVSEINGNGGQAESEEVIGWLTFGGDCRNSWCCSQLYNKAYLDSLCSRIKFT